METAKKKVLIDSGSDIESCVAILMALASPEIEVVGITSATDEDFPVLKELCLLAEKRHIPLYKPEKAPDFIKLAMEDFSGSLYIASLSDCRNIYQVLKDIPPEKIQIKQLFVTEKYIADSLKASLLYKIDKLTLISSDLAEVIRITLHDLVIMEALHTKSATYISEQIKEKLANNPENYLVLYNPIAVACILRPALFGGIFGSASFYGGIAKEESFATEEQNNILCINEVNIDAFFALLNERLAMLP